MAADKRKLYKVTGDGKSMGLALNIQTNEKGLFYDDLDREHILSGKIKEDKDTGLVWERDQGTPKEIEFELVTLKDYNENLLQHIAGRDQVPSFPSEAELYEWYRRQFCPWLAN